MGTYRYKYNDILTEKFLNQENIKLLNHVDVAKKLNIPIDPVIFYRNQFGLSTNLATIQREAKILCQTPLQEWQYGFLIGAIYGDGNLDKKPNGAIRFRVHHSKKQLEYIIIKHQLLRNICISDVKMDSINSCNFSTIYHPDLIKLYEITYNSKGIKVITEEAMQELTIFGLLAWFYDDGTLSKSNYMLSTCSFTLEEVKLIRQYLFKKFGIKTTPLKKSNGTSRYWYLYFVAETRNILSKYLSNWYIKCFDYKLHPEVFRSPETTRGEHYTNSVKI